MPSATDARWLKTLGRLPWWRERAYAAKTPGNGRARAYEFDESEHPRDEDGKWTEGSGSVRRTPIQQKGIRGRLAIRERLKSLTDEDIQQASSDELKQWHSVARAQAWTLTHGGRNPNKLGLHFDASAERIENELARREGKRFSKGVHSFASAQLDLPNALQAKLRAWVLANVAREDLSPDEVQDDAFHVTVLYGLKTDQHEIIRQFVEGTGPVRIELGAVASFDKHPDYDVLTVPIVKEVGLRALRKRLTEHFPWEATQDGYALHVTLAYVRKGAGRRHLGATAFLGATATVDRLRVSDSRGVTSWVSLIPTKVLAKDDQVEGPGRKLGVWRTIRGRRVFIGEGESLEEALKGSSAGKDNGDGDTKSKVVTLWKAERRVGGIKEGPRLGEFFSDNEATANNLAGGSGKVERKEVRLEKPLGIPSKAGLDFEFYTPTELNKILKSAGVAYRFSDVEEQEVWRHVDDGGLRLVQALKKAGYDSVQFPEFLGGKEQRTTLVFGNANKTYATPIEPLKEGETLTFNPETGERGVWRNIGGRSVFITVRKGESVPDAIKREQAGTEVGVIGGKTSPRRSLPSTSPDPASVLGRNPTSPVARVAVGSRDEAEQFAVESVRPGRWFHGAEARFSDPSEALRTSTPGQTRGAVFGSGVYLTSAADEATQYGDRVFEVRVNVRNPLVYPTEASSFQRLMDQTEPARRKTVAKQVRAFRDTVRQTAEKSGKSTEDVITAIARRSGYDAIEVWHPNRTWLVVPDPSQIMVIQGSPEKSLALVMTPHGYPLLLSREPTRIERKVDFATIVLEGDRLQAQAVARVQAVLTNAKDKMLALVERKHQAGELTARFVLDLELRGLGQLVPTLREALGAFFRFGQRTADGELLRGRAGVRLFAKDDLVEGPGGKMGVWRTVRGRKVFIEEGQNLDEALSHPRQKAGSSKETTDDPDTWPKWTGKANVLYHVTLADSLPGIARRGIVPASDPSGLARPLRDEAGKFDHTFFTTSRRQAEVIARQLDDEGSPSAILELSVPRSMLANRDVRTDPSVEESIAIRGSLDASLHLKRVITSSDIELPKAWRERRVSTFAQPIDPLKEGETLTFNPETGERGVWRNVGGRSVFIAVKKGESVPQAIKRAQAGRIGVGKTDEAKTRRSQGRMAVSDEERLVSNWVYPNANPSATGLDFERLRDSKTEEGRSFGRFLQTLPIHDGRTYRGVALDQDVLSRLTSKGGYRVGLHSSSSKSESVAREFIEAEFDPASSRQRVLLEFRGHGRDISSRLPEELRDTQEVVIPAGTRYRFVGLTRESGGVVRVVLEQQRARTANAKQASRKEIGTLALVMTPHGYQVKLVPEGLPPEAALEFFERKAALWATDVRGPLLQSAKAVLFDAIKRGAPLRETMAMLEQVFLPWLGDEDALRGDGDVTAPFRLETLVRTNTNEAMNEGRKAQFQEEVDSGFVIGFQFSAIIDSRTTPVCAFLDEKIFRVDSPELDRLTPPRHHNCFVEGGTRIYTAHGWRPIKSLERSDLVLTHQGRFQPITAVHHKEHPQRYSGDVVKLYVRRTVIANSAGQQEDYPFVTMTPEHPVLIDGQWREARSVGIGDRVSCLGTACEKCGTIIPWLTVWRPRWCGRRCHMQMASRKVWARPEHHKHISKLASKQMYREYANGIRDRHEITKAANKETRRRYAVGLGVFIRPEVRAKAEAAKQASAKWWHAITDGRRGDKNPMRQHPEAAKRASDKLRAFLTAHPEKHGNRVMGRAVMKGHEGYLSTGQRALYALAKKLRRGKVELEYPIKTSKKCFYADVALPRLRLAMEFDGSYWHQDRVKDRQRDTALAKVGWKTLRYRDQAPSLVELKEAVCRIAANHDGAYVFTSVQVVKVERWALKKPRRLYNISVLEDESYIAKGFIVHNCRSILSPVLRTEGPVTYITPRQVARGIDLSGAGFAKEMTVKEVAYAEA